MHLAAAKGDIKQLEKLLSQGADLNAKDAMGDTPLHCAARVGSLTAVKWLIQQGVNQIIANNRDELALNLATNNKHTEIVRYLKTGLEKWMIDEEIKNQQQIAKIKNDFQCIDPQDRSISSLMQAILRYGKATKKELLPLIEMHCENAEIVNQASASGRTALHFAAAKNESEIILKLIASGAKIDPVDNLGFTPLMVSLVSLEQDHFCSEASKTLLEIGANPNNELKQGFRAVNLAIAEQNVIGVELLLAHGAETHHTQNGFGLIHNAIITLNTQVTKLLIDREIGLNDVDTEGRTPLHCACIQGSFDIVELLLQTDLDVEQKCSHGLTAFHHAIKQKNYEIMARLNKHGANVNTQDNAGDTPLHYAVSSGDVVMVRYLILSDADSRITNHKNKAPGDLTGISGEIRKSLALSLKENEQGSTSIQTSDITINTYDIFTREIIPITVIEASKILQDVNATKLVKLIVTRHSIERFNQSELYSDAQRDAEIIKLIHEEPLETLECVTFNKFTALHLVAYYGNIEFLNALLRRGVKIDTEDKDGFTPLKITLTTKTPEAKKASEVLIKNGANLHHQDDHGFTPLHFAVMNHELALVILILQQGGKLNARNGIGRTPLFFACSNGDAKITKALLSRNAATDILDQHHWGAIHHAAKNGNDECLKLLIKHMKKVDSYDLDTPTPLMIAVNENKLNTAKLLVEAGANVNYKTPSRKDHFESTLHCAIIKKYPTIVEFLLEHKASLNEISSQGKTSLELAMDTKSLDIVKLILKHKMNLHFNHDFAKKHRAYAKKIEFLAALPLLKTELQIEPAIKPQSPPTKEKKTFKQDEILENQISPEEQAKRLEDEAKKKEEGRVKKQAEDEKRAAEEAKMKDAKKRELEIKKAKETLVKQAFNEIYDTLSKFTSSKGAAKDFFKGGMRKTAESFIDSQDKDYVQNGTNIVDRQTLAQDILSSTGMKKTNPKLFEDLKQQFANADKPVLKPASPTEVKANDPTPAHAEPMPESQDDHKALNKLLHEQEKQQNAKAAEARKKQASSSTSAPLLMAPQSQAEAEQIRKLVYDLVLLVTPYQDQTQRSLLEMKYDIVKMDVIVSQLNKTAGKRMMEALFANTEELSIIRNGALHLLEIHSEHQHFSQEQINHFFEDFYRTILERVSVLATLNIQPDTRLSHTLSRIQGESPLQVREVIGQMQNPQLAQETYKQFEINYRNHQLNKDNARSDVDDEIRNRIGILAYSAENNLSRPERVMLAVEIAELYRQRGNAGIKNGFMPYALIEARHDFAHQGIDIPDELIHELLEEYQSVNRKYK
jgi:serine/threonine-protein phosphatase 6 regulatory ankyrin repeat subunit B